MKLAVDIENIIFDYFGVIALQYEISSRALDKDMDYQVLKMKEQADLAAEFAPEEKPDKQELSFDEAKELAKRISEFTLRLMQGLGQQDPSTGQTFMRMDDASFEIAL